MVVQKFGVSKERLIQAFKAVGCPGKLLAGNENNEIVFVINNY
jgi:hypothetical protein